MLIQEVSAVVKNNLKLLDMDEHLRPRFENLYLKLISFAAEFDLIVDCSSSDVVVFLEDKNGNSICLG